MTTHEDGSIEYRVDPSRFGPQKIELVKTTYKSRTWSQTWTYAIESLRIWPSGQVLVSAYRVCRKGDHWQQVGGLHFWTKSSGELRQVRSI